MDLRPGRRAVVIGVAAALALVGCGDDDTSNDPGDDTSSEANGEANGEAAATAEILTVSRNGRVELFRFDAAVPEDLDIHLIVDNYATHKHEKIRNWLKRHKRVHLHFIPTSSSWLNLVERFFGLLTEKQLRRGVFTSVKDLETSITNFIEQNNSDPKPFVWTKTAEEILEKVGRARTALLNQQSI